MCECRGNSANEKKKKRGKFGKRDLREREIRIIKRKIKRKWLSVGGRAPIRA